MLLNTIKKKSLLCRKNKMDHNPYIMLLSRIDAQKSKIKGDLTDADVLVLVKSEIKGLEKEAEALRAYPEQYSKYNLALYDINILKELLPAALSEDEILKILDVKLDYLIIDQGFNIGALVKKSKELLGDQEYDMKVVMKIINDKK